MKEKFVESAKRGKVLVGECKKCNNIQLATIIRCLKCNSGDLKYKEVDGEGRVITYTILHVAPEGYEKFSPYAWVILEIDGVNVSGFLENVKSPSDLPLNSKVRIIGYDERGIILAKA